MSAPSSNPFSSYSVEELESYLQARRQVEEEARAAELAREAEVAQLQRRLLELQATPAPSPPLSAVSSSSSLRGDYPSSFSSITRY